MIRRGAQNAILSPSLEQDHLRAEGQSDEFHQFHTELRQQLERSSTGYAQFWSLHEETRTANVGLAPEVTRSRAGEEQLATDVSRIQNGETELPGQLQTLRQGECSDQ